MTKKFVRRNRRGLPKEVRKRMESPEYKENARRVIEMIDEASSLSRRERQLNADPMNAVEYGSVTD